MIFENKYNDFWNQFGESKKMVLSSSFNDIVTSRMISIVQLNKKLYFQTDKTFRKYNQLKSNVNIALCIDNVQIEGKCQEIGTPKSNIEFCNIYKKYFKNSFIRYSMLENEVLFEIIPIFIQTWIYIENIPYIETFDIYNKNYSIKRYI